MKGCGCLVLLGLVGLALAGALNASPVPGQGPTGGDVAALAVLGGLVLSALAARRAVPGCGCLVFLAAILLAAGAVSAAH